ncbi:MAG: RidA family protein [Planctomycetota bacterium]|jgi:2-iminobutanoate/2-iminopropanoate deaminase
METVSTDNAPAAIGPYSQAVKANGMIYCSGQISLDASSGELVGDDAASQCEKVMSNLRAVLEAGGSGISQVVKTTIFLKDMNDFGAVNEVYASAMGDHRPARATVEVSRLPKDVLVEIDCIALAD